MKLILSSKLKSSLIADFGVTLNEVEECFLNRTTSFEKTSEESKVKGFSFVAKTDRKRLLKIEFNIKNKLVHVLQLPDRSVTMEQEGVFCEIISVESMIQLEQPAIV